MSEQEERQKVIAEALTWEGTPYHEHGRMKGAGVDCLTFIAGVFINAGLVEPMEIPYYSPQWHLHRNKEMYLEGIARYLKETKTPQPGDVAVFKFGRCFAHGSIIIDWPEIIQAVKNMPVHRARADTDGMFRDRPVRFFSYWGK